MLAAFLTTVLFSISAVCGNRTAKLLGGTEANFWRLCFAAALLAVYSHTLGSGLSGDAFPIFLVSGCVGFGIGDMALFQALPRLGSRLSVMLTLCLSSPLAALIEWWWLRTELSLAEIVCGLVILAGVALALAPVKTNRSREPEVSGAGFQPASVGLLPEIESAAGSRGGRLEAGPTNLSRRPGTNHRSAQSEESRAPRQLAWGIVFGLVASLCQALGAVLSRKAFAVTRLAGEHIDGVTAAYQRILGGVAVGAVLLLLVKRESVFGALLGGAPSPASKNPARHGRWRRAWPWVLANGLAGPALGVSCYQWALSNTPTGVVLPIVAITPLVIIPFSYHLEGERPTVRSLAGGAMAVFGAAALAWVTTHPK
jgi:drug/metabolite transporter (DMT)-like permease